MPEPSRLQKLQSNRARGPNNAYLAQPIGYTSLRDVLMRYSVRLFRCLLTVLCVSLPAYPFDSPLSDEAVREAYFLGQRHDASFLAKYIKFLPPPKTGPHISSISFLTPFAQSAQFSSNYVGNYSAQQALLDHRGHQEFVRITVEIYLTNSYGALIPNPA